MTAAERWGDLPLLADTTAWSKIRTAAPDVQANFAEAVRSGQIVSSPIVRLEWLHDAKTHEEFDERDRLLTPAHSGLSRGLAGGPASRV